jgi:hypothetical protein
LLKRYLGNVVGTGKTMHYGFGHVNQTHTVTLKATDEQGQALPEGGGPASAGSIACSAGAEARRCGEVPAAASVGAEAMTALEETRLA